MLAAISSMADPDVSTEPIKTTIVGKYQVTVPTEVRELYGLHPGDIFEWQIDRATGQITLFPKRPQLITPVLLQKMSRKAEAAHQEAVALAD